MPAIYTPGGVVPRIPLLSDIVDKSAELINDWFPSTSGAAIGLFNSKTDLDVSLGKGRYLFIVKNPTITVFPDFKPFGEVIEFRDEDNKLHRESYKVYRLSYLPETDRLHIYVDIPEGSPFPVFIIYAGLVVSLFGLAASSLENILEEVKPILPDATNLLKWIAFILAIPTIGYIIKKARN